MTEVFYHVAPESLEQEIKQNGLQPTEASECDCGTAVHATTTKDAASAWAALRQMETMTTSEDYHLWKITLPDGHGYTIWNDLFHGSMNETEWADESFVICTTQNIPPKHIEKLGIA